MLLKKKWMLRVLRSIKVGNLVRKSGIWKNWRVVRGSQMRRIYFNKIIMFKKNRFFKKKVAKFKWMKIF